MKPYITAFMVTHLYDNHLRQWQIIVPEGESDGVEPARVHFEHTQKPLRGKIWIGINDTYPVGDVRRYVFKFDEKSPALNASDRNDLLTVLRKMFKENKNGMIELFEHKWQGGWYRNI